MKHSRESEIELLTATSYSSRAIPNEKNSPKWSYIVRPNHEGDDVDLQSPQLPVAKQESAADWRAKISNLFLRLIGRLNSRIISERAARQRPILLMGFNAVSLQNKL